MSRFIITCVSVLLAPQLAWGIVNGVQVENADPVAKATVSISGPGLKSFGSGVLIDKRHVLTAFHNYSLQLSTLIFLPGLFPLKVQFGTPAGVAGKIAVQDHFTQGGLTILELASDAPPEFEPAQLLSPEIELTPNARLIMAGYGTSEPSVLNNISGALGSIGKLRKAGARFAQYSNAPTEFQIGPLETEAARMSFGDSGGPFFLADGNGDPLTTASGQLIVVGILDRGLNFEGDAIAEHLAHFNGWIQRKTLAKSCSELLIGNSSASSSPYLHKK
jgi:hypothetical protein